MRAFVMLGLLASLAACDDKGAAPAGGQQAGAPVTAGGTLPAPPPAGAPPETRFPLPYPHATVHTYAVGQDVEILYYGGKWESAKITEIADIDGKQMIRTTYPGQTSPTPNLIHSNADEIRLPTGRLGKDLRVGRYSCFDGKSRPDLNFRVPQYGQYSDPYGEGAGTFTTSGDTITFKGGKFDGLTAQQLDNNGFYFNPQTSCSWELES